MKSSKNDPHVLIIGSGKMTQAIAFDFLNREPQYRITVIDRNPQALSRLTTFLETDIIETVECDINAQDILKEYFNRADVVVGAADYRVNFDLTELAIKHGACWVDLGGNNDVVKRQFTLSEQARLSGLSIIPDCGLAPGMVNVLAGHAAEKLDRIDELHFRVGGLPQDPNPPLFYGLLFSPDGLMNEYAEPARIIENEDVTTVPSLTGWERVHIGPPYGTLEAFHTSGGSSTMIETFSGKVKTLDYKTLRYAGHLRRVKFLSDLGFFSEEDFMFDDCDSVTPRQVTGKVLDKMGWVDKDVTIVVCWAIGDRDGKKIRIDFRLIDMFDRETGLTAMARTTGFSAAVVARMIIDGRIKNRGVISQETSVPPGDFVSELKDRGIEIQIEEKEIS